MSERHARLRPGDLVQVRLPDEILQSLDAEGTLDRLPFMPEMIEFCGRTFRVSRRVVKVCYAGRPNLYEDMLEFRGHDVVLLDGLRCSGAAHDGCQKSCVIFWRDAWLRKVEHADARSTVDSDASARLRARLKTSTGPKTYFCQASELFNATDIVSRREQFRRSVSEVRAGDCGVLEMAHRLGTWLFWKIRRRLLGPYPRGTKKSGPVESLNLQPGELVEVKSMKNILDTLNEWGCNRGLLFSPGMRRACGGPRRVSGRIDKIIMDGSGEMRQLHNTVALEGSLCGCPDLTVGGCSRAEINYWREIWLRRTGSNGGGASHP